MEWNCISKFRKVNNFQSKVTTFAFIMWGLFVILSIVSTHAQAELSLQETITSFMNGKIQHSNQIQITNGTDVDITSHPYNAAIFYSKQNAFVFNSVIVDKKWILTLPLIVDREDFDIRVGETQLVQMTEGTEIDKFVYHPKYDEGLAYFVMLIKLKKALKFSKKVKKIAIGKSSAKDGSVAVISGYGEDKNETINHLQEGKVQVISNENCKPAYPESIVTNTTICTKVDDIAPSIYDLSEPLVQKKKLYGIYQLPLASFCYSSSFCPSLYTDVTIPEIRDWIIDTIKHK